MVKSVLTYNSGTWGLSKTEELSLNAFHRRQLKQVLGVKYPVKMRNSIVYIYTWGESALNTNNAIEVAPARTLPAPSQGYSSEKSNGVLLQAI